MSHSLMLKCEQKRVSIIGGKTTQNWIEVFASELPSGMQPDIRCMHCHGKVRGGIGVKPKLLTEWNCPCREP
jgi:hypothetical protein